MRYLPQGGWVDMMSRIQICHWYCVMTDRTLVVDTTPIVKTEDGKGF